MKKLLVISLLCISFIATKAQTAEQKEEALAMKDQAVAMIDSGRTKDAIKLLKQAQELDPENIIFPYEIAYAYKLDENYNKSIEIAKELLKRPDVFDKVYQLIGNCYDQKGNPQKALEVYNKGLKLFPNSGRLFFEKGVIIASQENYFEALDNWEKGIIAEPTFSSNYFYASQVLSNTNEKIWAIYYGEIFRNLESNTERSNEISKLVYDTYKTCLPTDNDKWDLHFSNKATSVTADDMENNIFPFETVHNLAMEQGYKGIEPKFSIDNLSLIRKQFLKEWESDYADLYPNLIFDFHEQLLKNNMLEPYMYWLLKDGAEDEFLKWKKENETAYNNFIQWFSKHHMTFSDDNKTSRILYEL